MMGRWLVMVSPCAGLRMPAEPGSAQSGAGRFTAGAGVGVIVGAGRVLVGNAATVGTIAVGTTGMGGAGVLVAGGFVGGMAVSVGAAVAADEVGGMGAAVPICPTVGLGAGGLVDVGCGAGVFTALGDGASVAYTTAGGVATATGAVSVAENRVAITQPTASPKMLRLNRKMALEV